MYTLLDGDKVPANYARKAVVLFRAGADRSRTGAKVKKFPRHGDTMLSSAKGNPSEAQEGPNL